MNGQSLGDVPLQKEVHEYSHALTRGMGWESLAFEPAYEVGGVKHPLTP